MSTGDCLAAIATARNERGAAGMKLIADLLPIIGDATGVAECLASPSFLACGGAVIAIVPVVGDGARVLLRNGDEVIDVTVDGGRIIESGRMPADNVVEIAGQTCVYSCVIDGTTRYVGITGDVARRGKQHLRGPNKMAIEEIPGLDNLSRADAKAVEQTLINYYGLGKEGGTLLNKINSISATRNPTAYEQALIRGKELLDSVGYKWTN